MIVAILLLFQWAPRIAANSIGAPIAACDLTEPMCEKTRKKKKKKRKKKIVAKECG